MTRSVEYVVRRSDLARAAKYDLGASGVFQFSGATYSVRFQSRQGHADTVEWEL